MTPFRSWWFVDATEINALHDNALAEYGGKAGLLDPNCPEAKIEAAKNAVLYDVDEDEEPDLLRAAAYLIVYFTTGHCYADGNKRAAWMAALRLLHLNGIELRGDEPEAVQLIERVAQRKANVSDVVAWLGRPERFHAAPSREAGATLSRVEPQARGSEGAGSMLESGDTPERSRGHLATRADPPST